MKRFTLLFLLIVILPQCGNLRTKKTFESIQSQSKKRINTSPDWPDNQSIYATPLLPGTSITMQAAIAFGLRYNPDLQAHFEEVGISNADLVQAGFYTNPNVETIFKVPTKEGINTNVEVSASFMLSDLWQVPLRKKVAQRKLEIKTHQIMSDILQLRKDIQRAYLDCQFKKEYAAMTAEITAVVHEIQKRIDYRYQFGYNSKLDKYFALRTLAEWEAKIIEADALVDTAFISLYELLGVPMSPCPVVLADSLCVPFITISRKMLEQFALSTHPYVLIEQSKITKAKAEIRYEQSRIIDNVQLGISYERDFEKQTSGVGPAFGINIPLFNTNYGAIERAKYEVAQAQKTLLAQERMIIRNISNQCTLYSSYIKQIKLYNERVMRSVVKAIEFSKEFFDKMQMSMIVFLETQINLFQSKLKALELTYKAAQEYVELEFSAGAQLQNIKSSIGNKF